MTRTFQAWLPVDTQSFSKNQQITCYKSHFYPVLLKNEPELRSKTLAIFRWLKCKKRQNLLKKYYLHQVKTSLKTRKQKLSQNHRTTKIKTSMKHHVNLGKINREMDILGRLAVKKRLKMSPQTILWEPQWWKKYQHLEISVNSVYLIDVIMMIWPLPGRKTNKSGHNLLNKIKSGAIWRTFLQSKVWWAKVRMAEIKDLCICPRLWAL